MISFGSVCSGIEAASVAFTPLGWKAAWFSEIEPFPSAVLKHHYPDVPNLGDMTALPERILSGEIEAPDMLCGGTPCQAFSVAGLRNSLDDHRGNLTLTFVEIANAIDERRLVRGLDPAIIFWENVPGVLNTKDNAFGCFLAGLAGESVPLEPPGGRWANAGFIDGPQRAVAWRVLDAQYFGVAQRRRRVFVVASAGEDFDPAAVLFEFDGVRRDTAPSRETGQEVAGTIAARFGISRNNHEECVAVNYAPEIARCIATREGSSQDFETTTMVTAIPNNTQIATRHNAMGRGTGFGVGDAGDPAYTLIKGHCHAVAHPIAFSAKDHGADATDIHTFSTPAIGNIVEDDLASTMTKNTGSGGETQNPAFVVAPILTAANDLSRCPQSSEITAQVNAIYQTSMAVRRLTPVECERLQGFPDGYTNIPWRGKPESPDGPRYKALGNSWAVPVVRWIGERINRAL